jgi:hypothetical protein
MLIRTIDEWKQSILAIQWMIEIHPILREIGEGKLSVFHFEFYGRCTHSGDFGSCISSDLRSEYREGQSKVSQFIKITVPLSKLFEVCLFVFPAIQSQSTLNE